MLACTTACNIGALALMCAILPAAVDACSLGIRVRSDTDTELGCFDALEETGGEDALNCLSIFPSPCLPHDGANSAHVSIDAVSKLTATEFADYGFFGFDGTLNVTGLFPNVVRIGSYAFATSFTETLRRDATPASLASELIFDRGSLPQLVEIGRCAFCDFHGKIQFVNQPFPRLQYILPYAFYHLSAGSKVELIDQKELQTIDQGAFKEAEPFASIIVKGEMPKLLEIKNEAFRNTVLGEDFGQNPAIAEQHVVQLTNLPLLTTIGQDAFYDFLGSITFEGQFPLLEFIGAQAFREEWRHPVNEHAVLPTINLPFGLPSLKCIGYSAFSRSQWLTAAFNPEQLVMKGEYPCLNVVEDADHSYRWNSPDRFFKYVKKTTLVNVNFGVQNCRPFISNHTSDGQPLLSGWCHETETMCSSIHGSAGHDQCASEEPLPKRHTVSSDSDIVRQVNPNDKISINPDPTKGSCLPDCSLGIINRELGCIPSGLDADGVQGDCHISLCSNFPTASRVDIRSRADVVSVAFLAFAGFPGTLTMEGHFPRLHTLGWQAFYDAGDRASYLHFGLDSMPMLIEISGGAFRNFRGNVRFVDSPFPKLQRIGESAFRLPSNGKDESDINVCGNKHPTGLNSIVDLRDHASIMRIGRAAFDHYCGHVLLTGNLPKLELIGEKMFSGANPAATMSRVILNATQVPNLVEVGNDAFRYFAGTLQITGTFPRLEFLGYVSWLWDGSPFKGVSRGFVDIVGGPSLRCLGSMEPPEKMTVTIAGDFPCLNVGLQDAGDRGWNAVRGWNHPEGGSKRINLGLRDCTNAAEINHISCERIDGMECTARYGDNIAAPCESNTLKVTAFRPAPKDCALGIAGGRVSCLEVDAGAGESVSDCGRNIKDGCKILENDYSRTVPLVLNGRDDVTRINSFAFFNYPWRVEVRGHFPRLTHFGLRSFHGAGDESSTISFGTDDLPVLVEIEFAAFYNFRGNIRFVRSPFPQLQVVGPNAFNIERDVEGGYNPSNSKVELVDQLELTVISFEAFRGFGAVTVRGLFSKLELVAENSFRMNVGDETALSRDSVVELVDLPSLTKIDRWAFRRFRGKVVISGSFPLLEVIGKELVVQVGGAEPSRSYVHLQHAPALRCVGFQAFADVKNVTLSGAFPCLQLEFVPSSNRTGSPEMKEINSKFSWNDPTVWWLPNQLEQIPDRKANLNLEVGSWKGDCTASPVNCIRLNSGNDICESSGGDRTESMCHNYGIDVDANIFSAAGDEGAACDYGMKDGIAVCLDETEGASSECSPADFGRSFDSCSSYQKKLVISTNRKIKRIITGAFYSYGGTIKMRGRFESLTHILYSGFHSAGDADSSIVFGHGSLPHLVEIATNAFRGFKGVLRFVNNPFPNLQIIGPAAFSSHHTSTSRIELIDQQELKLVHERAFKDYWGLVTIKGSLPKLAGIGKKAFEVLSQYQAGMNTESYIELANLQKLDTISSYAFQNFQGSVRMTGCFPKLRSIGRIAFIRVRHLTVALGNGAPGLTCIGHRPFQKSDGLRNGLIEISGSFPCLWPHALLPKTISKVTPVDADGFSWNNLRMWDDEHHGQDRFKLQLNACPPGSKSCQKNDEEQRCNVADYTVPATSSGTVEDGAIQFIETVCNDRIFFDLATDDDDDSGGGDVDDSNAGAGTPDSGTTGTKEDVTSTAPTPTVAQPLDITADEKTSSPTAGAFAGTLAVLAVVIVAVVWQRRQRNDFSGNLCRSRQTRKIEAELCAAANQRAQLTFLSKYSRRLFSTVQSVDEYTALVAALELPRGKLKVVRQLGSGNYGAVVLAQFNNPPGKGTDLVHVAVKSRLPDETDATVDEALLIEALVLHSLKHQHILGLVGICTSLLPFLVVTEHMTNGDLKTYLRACRPSQPKPKARLTLYDVSLILEHIAQALAHLEKMAVIHRDVAARNVLVGAAPTQVKLGDLGAARSVFRAAEREYTATSDHMPVRWMALESLMHARFTSKSDVWSFGVFCWEVTTHGKTPYGVFGGAKEISDHLKNGGRLEASVFTPPGLFKHMLLCWSEDPKRRPRFADLIHILGAIRGAVAVSPEATMILDSNNEVVQQGRDRACTTDSSTSRISRNSERRRTDAGSAAHEGVGGMEIVLNPTFGANSSRVLVAPDGYVEDNFEQDGQPAAQTTNSSRILVAPDGYVEDNFEQGTVATNSGRILVAPDGYVEDNFEQGTVANNSGRILVAPDGYVEDNFEQGTVATNSGRILVAPDGYVEDNYVEDNFEQEGQPAVQTSGRVLVAPDGYVQDNFEQDGEPRLERSGLSCHPQPSAADDNTGSTDHTVSRVLLAPASSVELQGTERTSVREDAGSGTKVEHIGEDETRL